MKTIVIAVASIMGAIASPAFAAYDRYGNYYDDSRTYFDSQDQYRRGDSARVIDTQPVYAASGTKEQCWNPREGRFEDRNEPRDPNRIAGTALGALIGGVIGHGISDSSGGTAAGAILGGIAGNQIERQQQRSDLDTSQCRTVASGDGSIQAYDVRYEYRGQQYVARMDHDPGQWLRPGSDIRDDGTPFESNVAYNTYYSEPSYPVYRY